MNIPVNRKIVISVIGGHDCTAKTKKQAYETGKIIAELGAVLVCGGLGGVMQAAAQGAKENSGLTIGILPGKDNKDANKYIDIPLATGLGYARNTIVAGSADIVVALKGREGTLSEIGFALSERKTVVGLDTWDIPRIIKVNSIAALKKKLTQLIAKISE